MYTRLVSYAPPTRLRAQASISSGLTGNLCLAVGRAAMGIKEDEEGNGEGEEEEEEEEEAGEEEGEAEEAKALPVSRPFAPCSLSVIAARTSSSTNSAAN